MKNPDDIISTTDDLFFSARNYYNHGKIEDCYKIINKLAYENNPRALFIKGIMILNKCISSNDDGEKYIYLAAKYDYPLAFSLLILNKINNSDFGNAINFYKENNRIDEPLFKLFYAMALLNIGEKHPYYDMAYDILQNIKPEIQKIKDKTIENYSLYEEFNLYNKNFYLNLDEILAAYHCDFMLFYYVLPQKATKDLYLSNADSANKYISSPRSKFYYLKILLLTRMKNYFNLGIEENINKEIEEFKIAFKNLKEHERNYYKATYNQMLEIFSSAPYKINE